MVSGRRGDFARAERHPHTPDQFRGWCDAPETALLWLHDYRCVRHPDLYRADVLGIVHVTINTFLTCFWSPPWGKYLDLADQDHYRSSARDPAGFALRC